MCYNFLFVCRIMEFTFVKDLAIIIGGLVALFTFIHAILEYSRQGAQKRAEQFVMLRRRLKENPAFSHITSLLYDDHPDLRLVSPQEKRDYLGLLEEVALLMNSRLIRPDVAHYMFGYYVVRCQESANFWENIDGSSIYWSLFHSFAVRMSVEEKRFYSRRRKLRF